MRIALLLICCLVASLSLSQEPIESPSGSESLLSPHREKALEKWVKAIDEFDVLNEKESHVSDAILFIGSSSIRRWASLATDLAPYRTIRRGYGGAKYTDMAVLVDQIVRPHQYRAIVMFVGNGVVGKEDDHTPDMIESLARHIISVSQSHQPHAPFFVIEITPCEKRFSAWPKIRAVNARLREVALTTSNTYFIPTASHFLRSDNTPRPELFVDDRLHLNETGYQLWSTLIRRRLDEVLRAMEADLASEVVEESVGQ